MMILDFWTVTYIYLTVRAINQSIDQYVWGYLTVNQQKSRMYLANFYNVTLLKTILQEHFKSSKVGNPLYGLSDGEILSH